MNITWKVLDGQLYRKKGGDERRQRKATAKALELRASGERILEACHANKNGDSDRWMKSVDGGEGGSGSNVASGGSKVGRTSSARKLHVQ